MNLALAIAIVSLYSFGHWIGATILFVILALMVLDDYNDPTGLKRLFNRYR